MDMPPGPIQANHAWPAFVLHAMIGLTTDDAEIQEDSDE
jgi:hypothetical protein